jgi:hypothetical protein
MVWVGGYTRDEEALSQIPVIVEHVLMLLPIDCDDFAVCVFLVRGVEVRVVALATDDEG